MVERKHQGPAHRIVVPAALAGAALLAFNAAPVRAATEPPSETSALPAPSPSAVQPALEILIGSASWQPGDSSIVVDLRLLNGTAEAASMPLPDRLQAEIRTGHETRKVWLQKAPLSDPHAAVPAGGFVQVRYHLSSPDDAVPDDSSLSIPAWSRQQVVIANRPVVLADGIFPPGTAGDPLAVNTGVLSFTEK